MEKKYSNRHYQVLDIGYGIIKSACRYSEPNTHTRRLKWIIQGAGDETANRMEKELRTQLNKAGLHEVQVKMSFYKDGTLNSITLLEPISWKDEK